MTDVTLIYDMRAPEFGTAAVDLYAAAIAQSAWADKHGFAGIAVSEHHASDDGYLPSPIVMASAISAVTERVLIHLAVVVLPLYHPIRLAEDLAVLDLISGGRMRLTVAGGYRPEEFASFGADIKKRPSLMEEGIDTLKKAWTGEPFEFRGETVQIRPRPAQQPRPEISLGGASPATARRAAEICDDYSPIFHALYETYLEELDKLGKPRPKEPRQNGDGAPMFIHVAEDPDRDWALIAPHALHESNSYAQWAAGLQGSVYHEATDAEQLRTSGVYRVLTPDEAVTLAGELGRLTLKPLMGGLDPDLGWASMELTASKVMPKLTTDAAGVE